MKLIPFALFILAVVSSCRKDPKLIQPEQSISSFDIPNTPGSWWKYDWYRIDSLGNETLLDERDCLYVVQDTLVNGELFTQLRGDYSVYSEIDLFRRDSAGFMIDTAGNVLFSTGSLLDTLQKKENFIYNYCKLTEGLTHTVSVPAGTFQAYETQTHYRNSDGSPYTACSEIWLKREYYSSGIGLISTQSGYISLIQNACTYDEARLIDYFIAP